MKSHSLWKTKASVSWAACRSSSNGLRELRTLQTSCESRGWEMSSCKPIKLHWTNALWAFSRADGRRPCLQHTHERTPDIRDGKRQWAKTRSSFLFFFSLFFIFLDFSVSLLCAGRESKPWHENYTSEGWWMLQDGSRTSPSTPKEDIHFSFSWWLTLLITERRQGGCIKLMNTCGWNEIGLITPPYCLRCLLQTEKKMGRSVWKRKEERKRKTGNEIQK